MNTEMNGCAGGFMKTPGAAGDIEDIPGRTAPAKGLEVQNYSGI